LSYRKASPTGCHYSYACPQKFGRKIGEPNCHAKEISTNKLDKIVWDYVSALIQDADKVKKSIRLLKEKRDKEKTFNQDIYDTLIVEKAKIQNKKSRLLDLYTDDKMDKEALDRKMNDLDCQQKDFEKQIKQAEKEIQAVEKVGAMEAEVERLCLEYQYKIQNADFETKKIIIRRWVKEINLLDNGDIVIKVRIPAPTNAVKLKAQFIANGVTTDTHSLMNSQNFTEMH